MTMLSERIDAVIGVDTHTDTHTAVIVNAAGGVLEVLSVPTTEHGYGQLLDALLRVAPGPRVAWAIEGSGSYGAGLRDTLHDSGAEIHEIRTSARPRGRAKNDTNDATAIARTALNLTDTDSPRTGAVRETLRLTTISRNRHVKTRTSLVNLFKSVILTSGPYLRERLRTGTTATQLTTATRLRAPRTADEHLHAALDLLHDLATQITQLQKLIDKYEARLDTLTRTHAPALRAIYGVGPVNGAQILITFSHPGRFRSHAAFAAVAGTSPLEASSGRTIRHRLNRTGDRQLNTAIHRIVLTRRIHHHPETDAYISRRHTEGLGDKDINRRLKRYLTRTLYNTLETCPPCLDRT